MSDFDVVDGLLEELRAGLFLERLNGREEARRAIVRMFEERGEVWAALVVREMNLFGSHDAEDEE